MEENICHDRAMLNYYSVTLSAGALAGLIPSFCRINQRQPDHQLRVMGLQRALWSNLIMHTLELFGSLLPAPTEVKVSIESLPFKGNEEGRSYTILAASKCLASQRFVGCCLASLILLKPGLVVQYSEGLPLGPNILQLKQTIIYD